MSELDDKKLFSLLDLRRIVARAEAIERDGLLTARDVHEVAKELGLSEAAVRRAIEELSDTSKPTGWLSNRLREWRTGFGGMAGGAVLGVYVGYASTKTGISTFAVWLGVTGLLVAGAWSLWRIRRNAHVRIPMALGAAAASFVVTCSAALGTMPRDLPWLVAGWYIAASAFIRILPQMRRADPGDFTFPPGSDDAETAKDRLLVRLSKRVRSWISTAMRFEIDRAPHAQ